MSDLPSALGIEAVELVSDGGRSDTVRVTGRWRRRRPELRGQAVLVVESETGRRRFPAMPEPPSLTGAAPGTWRMTFTVPAELAPQLPGGTFLQLGAVMVRLPIGEVPSPLDEVAEGLPPELREARSLRSSELADARTETDRLRGVISERERDLRAARQHVHAERAVRIEVEQRLTEKSRAAAHDLRVLHEHVADLERDLTRMRRAVDEAEHSAAVAEAARADAERRNRRAYEAVAFVRRELEQVRATALAPPVPDPVPIPLAPAPVPTPSAPAPVPTPPAPAPVPTPPAPAPGPIQAEQLTAALARLREESATAPTPERPARPWLGKAFRTLAARDPSEAGRLLLALLPAQRAADSHPVAYDLIVGDLICAHVTVESLAVRVELDATARPASEVDFGLVGDLGSIARLLAAGPVRRRLGRLPVGGRLARIRGDRHRLGAIEHLLDAPLTVGRLHAAGVRLDPVLGMTLAALMIEPAWTAGERFSVAHQEPAASAPGVYLHVRDGRPPVASSEPPHGPVASIVVCPADQLLPALAGAGAAEVAGEERPVGLLRQWIERAQSG